MDARPLGVSAKNARHCGVFATTAVTAPGYLAANRALTSIEQAAPRRFVPVPAEVRERAYAASPAFRELRPTLEGPSWARVVSCNVESIPNQEAGHARTEPHNQHHEAIKTICR